VKDTTLVYCFECGQQILLGMARYFSKTINGHPGTYVVCQKCFDKGIQK